ncbi:ATP-dependent RNA helicase HrpB [Nymphon striatum]|nr:ATP-dependent RNA helicase HrpB [Nymphon striatum]
MSLPIEDVVDALVGHMTDQGVCVLQAPPGAGKTTRVPLALLAADAFEGRLIMLEPRRLAARAAAERMAQTLGEPVGQTVGYRMRGEAKASKATRIEVVTEGILTRMIQSDPELTGVGCVVFDEFHERSLNGDLGTGAGLGSARCLAPRPQVDGHVRHFGCRPRSPPYTRFEVAAADLVNQAVKDTTGGVLVFLPGEGEIRRVMNNLTVPKGAVMVCAKSSWRHPSRKHPLPSKTCALWSMRAAPDVHGSIPDQACRDWITEKVSRAEATQRQGRAGRVQPGVCYRMWTRAEEGALPAFPPAEIEAADLTGLALELANWGSRPEDLAFLTPPPENAFNEANALLEMLGALKAGRITDHGRSLAADAIAPAPWPHAGELRQHRPSARCGFE